VHKTPASIPAVLAGQVNSIAALSERPAMGEGIAMEHIASPQASSREGSCLAFGSICEWFRTKACHPNARGICTPLAVDVAPPNDRMLHPSTPRCVETYGTRQIACKSRAARELEFHLPNAVLQEQPMLGGGHCNAKRMRKEKR